MKLLSNRSSLCGGMIILWPLLFLLLHPAVNGQFTCTFSGASDAGSCVQMEDETNQHCVWCALEGKKTANGNNDYTKNVVETEFGFCLSEIQAETIEQMTPDLVHCDRYSGDTDDGPVPPSDDSVPTDDSVPPSDDTPATDDTTPNPTTDDTPSNTDDATPPLPDNYWQCLKEKDSDSCTAKDCTWCDTPVGYGVCMTGPSAEAAQTSKWFTCKTNSKVTTTTTTTTTSFTTSTSASSPKMVNDPLDPSCALVYLQDPSQEACEGAVDADGNPCEYCSLQGDYAFQFCLNVDQAEMGKQFGVLECGGGGGGKYDNEKESLLLLDSPVLPDLIMDPVVVNGVSTFSIQDPLDPSCALIFLQDPSQEACEAAVDADGNPCEFCSLQGSTLQVCLNADQAQIGEQFGLECGDNDTNDVDIHNDPSELDLTCSRAFWSDPSVDSCLDAVDMDGKPCEYCSISGSLVFCVNAEQASILAISQTAGMECETMFNPDEAMNNVMAVDDTSCFLAFLVEPSVSGCENAVDRNGKACSYCTAGHLATFGVCLTSEQVDAMTTLLPQVAWQCSLSSSVEDQAFPDDLIECLEHYQESDCRQTACTWCNTQVGMGFCVTSAVAEITKPFPFFDCEFGASTIA